MWKDLNDAEYRRHFYMRERSYASEPGSRILLKLDDEKEKIVPDLGLASDHDEDDDTIECDLGMRTSTLSEPLDFGRRSQTLLEVVSLWSRDTCISLIGAPPVDFTYFAHELKFFNCARNIKLPTSSWAHSP